MPLRGGSKLGSMSQAPLSRDRRAIVRWPGGTSLDTATSADSRTRDGSPAWRRICRLLNERHGDVADRMAGARVAGHPIAHDQLLAAGRDRHAG